VLEHDRDRVAAENDVAMPIGNEAGPVIESLAVMFLEVLTALFLFDQGIAFQT
jgi:hypothetical protein